MDWTPTEMQTEVGRLAKQVLRGSRSPWSDLAEAGLMDLEDLLDITALLEQVGRSGAVVPVLPTLLFGAPGRQEGDAADVVLTGVPHAAPVVVVDGTVSGTFECVPFATVAARMVLPTTDGLVAVALSPAQVEKQEGTNGDDLGRVVLDRAPAVAVGDRADAARWRARCDVGVCALLFGLSREALIMTAKYVSTREQFGRPVATFQAVSQRAADAWIQLNAMELTLMQAAWRVDAGLDADREVAIARYQASHGAHHILAAAQHLHGGHGFDKDYPLHRYFLTVKAWEFVGGGSSAWLARIGQGLAAR